MNHQTTPQLTATIHKGALRTAIGFHGYTQRELASKAGVSRTTIKSLTGAAETCSPETAAKVAKALGVRTEAVFTLTLTGEPVAK